MRAVSEVVSPVPQAAALTRGQPVLVCFNPSLARPGLFVSGQQGRRLPCRRGWSAISVLVVASFFLFLGC